MRLQNVSCPPSPVPCYGLSRPSASPAPKLQAPWRGAGSGGRFHERGREARRANTRASHPVNAAGCCQTQSASSDGVRISRARKAETRDTRACIHDRRAQDGAQPGLSRNVQQQQQGGLLGQTSSRALEAGATEPCRGVPFLSGKLVSILPMGRAPSHSCARSPISITASHPPGSYHSCASYRQRILVPRKHAYATIPSKRDTCTHARPHT